KAGLPFFTGIIDRLIDIFECAPGRIFNYPGPGFISFTKCDCVGMPGPSISTQRLVRNFGDVWTADHHRHACHTDRIGDSISFLNHSGHCADPNQLYLLLTHKPNYLVITHWTGIGIDQNNLVLRWSKGLQEKHPEVRHEVASDD